MRKALTLMVAALVAAIPVPAGAVNIPPPCGELLFCEDFQSLPTGGATSLNWGVDTKYGTLTVEKLRRGQKVLHVHTERNGRAFLRVDDFAAPGNSFYGRIRLRVDAFPRQPDWARTTSPRCGCWRAWRATSMSSSLVTGQSAELMRYTRGSSWIGRTCSPCVRAMFPMTRGSVRRPSPAGSG